MKGLGFQADDFKVSGFDLRDAQVGHSVAYEFDVEIDNKVLPFKLLEDVNRWEYVDLPIFRVDNGLVEKGKSAPSLPVLAPFQLAGPMELWIQDAKDMRISLPVSFSSSFFPIIVCVNLCICCLLELYESYLGWFEGFWAWNLVNFLNQYENLVLKRSNGLYKHVGGMGW